MAGAEIITASGALVRVLEPAPDALDLSDIAHALSHLCRFTGHTRVLYTVAHHSLVVSLAVEQTYPGNTALALAALLHDAQEAYLHDIPATYRALVAIDGQPYEAIERRWHEAIAAHQGIEPMLFTQPGLVQIDRAIAHDEIRALFARVPDDLELPPSYGFEGAVRKAARLSPEHARRAFLQRHAALAAAL